MKSTRRGFIKAAAVGAGAITLSPVAAQAELEFTHKSLGFYNHTYKIGENEVGMLFDSSRCVGCQACVASCRAANFDFTSRQRFRRDASVWDEFVDDEGTIEYRKWGFAERPRPFDFDAKRRRKAIFTQEHLKEKRWVVATELDYRTKNIIKAYVNPEDKSDFAFMKRQCMHCNHPGCVSACPVSAMTKHKETGVVEYHHNICIGCRYCQIACPFNVPTFEWHEAFGMINKCGMCQDTKLHGKSINGKTLREIPHEEQPACCSACPVEAVIYGNRIELEQEARKRIAERPGFYFEDRVYGGFEEGERNYGGTNVIYISRVDFEKLGLPNFGPYSFAQSSETIQHTVYKYMAAPVVLYVTILTLAMKNKRKFKKALKEQAEEDRKKGGHA